MAQTPATSTEINKAVDAALAALENKEVSDPASIDVTKQLKLINALLKLQTQQETASSFEVLQSRLSSTLLDELKKTPAKWPADLIDSFVAQADYFDKLVLSRDEVRAFAWRAKAIIDQKAVLESKASDIEVSKWTPQLISVLQAVATKTANTIDDTKVVSTALDGILGKEEKVTVLKGHKESVAMLSALRKKLAPFSASMGDRVHVISALYGDINAINQLSKTTAPAWVKKHHRWCIASATVAKSCERQRSCSLSTITDFRNGICSYDPAPFLDKAYKALVVWYVCRPNLNEANWIDPSTWSTDKFDPRPTRQVRSAVLYSKDQSFDCVGPVEQ